MLYLAVGCLYSHIWEEAIRTYLKDRQFEFEEVEFAALADLDLSKSDILISRYNDHCKSPYHLHASLASKVGAVFPSSHVYYYYDDKWKEYQLFRRQGINTPETYLIGDPIGLSSQPLKYPLVCKKAHGAGSKHVSLLNAPHEIPDTPCLVQPFCPGNDGDYRVVCIGHRMFCFFRKNRENDWRASGSGLYEKCDIIPLAEELYRFCKDNQFEVMAFDVLKDSDDQWTVLEMSYTFPLAGHHGENFDDVCDYYLDMKTGERVRGHIDPVKFIFDDLLRENGGKRWF